MPLLMNIFMKAGPAALENRHIGTTHLLTEDELKIFIEILLRDENYQHIAFILILLKELNYDFSKFMRVISAGLKTNNILQKSLLNKVLSTVREAVIIKDLEFRHKLSTTTITQLSRSIRYRELGISRAYIYKTIHKHGLSVLD